MNIFKNKNNKAIWQPVTQGQIYLKEPVPWINSKYSNNNNNNNNSWHSIAQIKYQTTSLISVIIVLLKED